MFYSIFSPSTFNFPSRPNYITKYAFGITKADVNVVVTNSNNEGLYKTGTNIERHLKKKTTSYMISHIKIIFPCQINFM